MYNMIKVKKFDNTLNDYESKDLSFLLFQNIDMTKDKYPKSFYRADFRRSKLDNCYFSKNAFGRADFVDVCIENTIFEEVNWGSCLFKNSYIINSTYKNNSYRGVSLQFNTFKDCVFENERFIFNAYKCNFIGCVFKNCTFEKSSLEDIVFEKCSFDDVNIAECHSENFKFDSCKINDLKLGITYWCTYLYKYTKIESCTFMYKGKIINVVDLKYFSKYMDMLLQQDRLYEFLNCIIINNKLYKNVVSAFRYVLHRLEELPTYIRNKNLIDILDMLKFYYNYETIGYEEYSDILGLLDNLTWENYTFEESNAFLSKIYEINRMFDNFNFSLKYLSTINLNSICEMVIRLSYDKEKDAIEYLDTLFNRINLCINKKYNPPLYKKINVEKGSIVLTISSFLLLGVLLSYTYKKASHNNETIKFERVLNESLQKKLIDDNITTAEIKKICAIAKENNLLDTTLNEESIKSISTELTTGEIISIILKKLS